MKNVNVKLYLAVQKDIETTQAVVDKFEALLSNCVTIVVNSSLVINRNSTDKQYVYAVSVLNNMIAGSKLLGIDSSKLEEDQKAIIVMRNLEIECREWSEYGSELARYSRQLYALLSNEDKISLLEYPKKQ